MATIERQLSDGALDRGAALVGFADLTCLPPESRQSMPMGVSLAVQLDARIVASICRGPTTEYIAEYERANGLLADLSDHLADLLESGGSAAISLPPTGTEFDRETLSTALPHKTVATRAGLGWIGKNALLTTEKYGSAVRLGTVLTDAGLQAGRPVDRSRCGECTLCVRECPAAAPTGRNWSADLPRDDLLDAGACGEYAKRVSAALGSEHTVCGRCIPTCPWTRKYLESSS